nr:hypothetical protein [Tanacetum cinerariifolium]
DYSIPSQEGYMNTIKLPVGNNVIEADDQAIQTILFGLTEDIYAAVDSYETAQEIWLRVQQMMKGSDIRIQKKKAKLFNKWERFTSNNGESIESYYHQWSRHVTIVHQTKDLHTADYTQLYDFLKYNQKEVDELKAERLAKTQDPLALMATSNNPYAFPAPHQDQPSFNHNYMQQPMPNPKDITNSTTAINMALALMAKAFKLNYSTPTNNNHRILSNPCNRQIAQPGINMGQDRQMQMVGGNGENQFRQNANQNLNGNGNLVAARAEGNAAEHNGNQIRYYNCRGVGHFARNCTVRPRRRDAAYLQTQLLIAQKEEARIQLQAKEFDLMAATADLDEIEEVNASYILMANLQQASTSGTQTDKAPVYDSDGSAEYNELLEPIPEPHQVPQNENNVISNVTSVEQSGELVEQHPTNVEKTHNTKTRRPQPRSNTKNYRVPSASKSSRSKNKEVEVEEHHRNLLLSKNKKHMSFACNSIKLDSQNVISKVVCAMCKQCLISVNHDVCLRNYVNGKTSRGKKQTTNVSIKEKQKKRKPKVKKPKKVGFIERLSTPKPSKPSSFFRWSPTGRMFDLNGKIIASSESESQYDCSKGDNACTSNPMKPSIKRFPNATFCLVVNSNMFMVRKLGLFQAYDQKSKASHQFRLEVLWNWQFYDSDLEVAYRRNACFVRNLEGVDLLKGDRSTNLYTINLHEMASASPICLMACASSTKSWLWHQRLSHLNFDTINDLAKNDLVSGLPKFKYHKEHLCPSCEQEKSKRASYPPKPVPNSRQRLHLLHMDLCGPMRIASINEKLSSVRTPQQNGVMERINRTLVEAARTMLIFSRTSLFLWAEAIATACFTQNRSIIYRRFNKTPYELINGRKLDISFLHVFRALCYPKNDREDIRKLGTKGDISFFIGYSADSCAYRVYNRRSKKIMETMNMSFYELSAMDFEQHTAQRTVPDAQAQQARQTSTTTTSIAYSALTPTNSSSQATNLPISSQDVDELRTQQQHVQQQGNSAHLQSETVAKNVQNAMFDGNTFVNPFTNRSTSAAESSSSQNVDPSNMHAYYQPYPHEFQWTKDHPLEQNVKEAMTNPAWIESMQEELFQFKIVDDSGFELTGFSDADYARCKDTFKSTSGGAQFLGEKLVSQSLKKQDCMTLSTMEVEYVSLSACCAQVL